MAEADSDASPSDVGTESSSGLGKYDVAIYFHHTITDKVVEAERLLIEDGVTSCLSFRDAPAGRPKLANLYSVAKRSSLRVFVVTDKFVKEDFRYHLRLLDNADISNKENSLLLMKRQHKRHVPMHLGDLTCSYFEDRISGEEIARLITQFMYKDSLDYEQELTPYDLTSKVKEDEQTDEDNQKRYEKELLKFKEMFGTVTKKRCYILFVSPITDGCPSLASIASVPWVRVFDFDTRSSVSGLLLWAGEALSKKNHTKTNRPDHIEAPDDNVANWVSVVGDADNAYSLQAESGFIPETAIFRHGECLAEYCVGRKVPVILVMWYCTIGDMNNNLDHFLGGLRHHFMARLQSFNCIICVPEMLKKKKPLWRTLERLQLLTSVIVIPLRVLCSWLESASSNVTPNLGTDMTLPKYPDDGVDLDTVEIQSEDLAWIRNQLYILATSKSLQEKNSVDSKIPEHISVGGLSFLKGKEINWNVVEYGGYDVCRELLKKVKEYVEDKHLSTGRSGLVTIYHAPGGGGTTFARRLLFELHDRVPSGEVSSDRLALKNLEERLLMLRNLTLLPTVLLLDGKSMIDVKRLLALGTKLRVIIIHVRRYIHKKAPSREGTFFLQADVSSEEAEEFANVYGKAAPQRRKQLNRLTDEVRKGNKRCIYEYGLTAFNSKYEGVRRYVHGYLQIDKDTELQDWHKVLVMLSMADYYGHRSLPCKLFSKMLNKDESEVIEFCDLPHAAQQLITESGDLWKTAHYIISKLILEQALVKRSSWEYRADDRALTPEASQELCEWALIFIDNIHDYVGNSRISPHIWEILTAVFIRRDYDDPGRSELGIKAHYSKLLEEIESSEQQKVIFEKLAESFPGHAEFRAHLGRLYSKQGEFDKASECFELALEARRQEVRKQDTLAISGRPSQEQQKGDDVLERIYNMSAFACISHIRSKLGARLGKLTKGCLRGKNLPTLANDCVKKATEAINNFQRGRLHYQKGSNTSFANLGELKVRLQLTELAKHISGDNFESLLEENQFKKIGDFVLQSFHECDVLLAQCISDQSRNIDVPEDEITFCFNQFNFVFQNATKALELWAGNDSTIHSMQCHLSMLKIKLKQDRSYFRLNEDVKTGDEIEDLVQLCERICDKIWKNNASNIRLSSYMMEWLRAIRHRRMTRRYTQKDVLSRVEKWKASEEIGTLANFYYYLLTTVVSLSTISREIANTYSRSSHKMKEYLRKNDAIPLHMHGVNEWLGCNDNPHEFNQLIHSTDLGEWKDKFWVDPMSISRLRVCTGSIVFCRPHDGIITLDGGRDPPIQVFFVPQKFDISTSHSRKKTRVEFYIGFNPRHLAQAFEVTMLKTYPCPKCRTPTEVPTLGKDFDDCEEMCCRCETMVKIFPNCFEEKLLQ